LIQRTSFAVAALWFWKTSVSTLKMIWASGWSVKTQPDLPIGDLIDQHADLALRLLDGHRTSLRSVDRDRTWRYYEEMTRCRITYFSIRDCPEIKFWMRDYLIVDRQQPDGR
jgi:hypothetical protein